MPSNPTQFSIYVRGFLRFGVALLYLYMCGFALWQSYYYPIRNFDALAYSAAALKWGYEDKALWHKAVKEEAAKTLSASEQAELITQNKRASKPEALAAQMPFYNAKPLFVAAVWAGIKAGLPGLEAVRYLALAATALLMVLCFFVAAPGVNRSVWRLLVLAFFFAFSYPINVIARLPTPDSLAALVCMVALLAVLSRRSLALWFSASAVALCVRPDSLLLTLPLGVALVRSQNQERDGHLFAGGAVCLLIGLWALKHYTAAYGLGVAVEYYVVNPTAAPELLPGELPAAYYLMLFQHAVMPAAGSLQFLALAGWSVLALIIGWRYWQEDALPVRCLLAGWLFGLFKLALFPLWDEALLYAAYLVIFTSSLAVIATHPKLGGKR